MPTLDESKYRTFQNSLNSRYNPEPNININKYTSPRLFHNRFLGIFLKVYVEGILNKIHHTILQIRDLRDFSKSSSQNPKNNF